MLLCRSFQQQHHCMDSNNRYLQQIYKSQERIDCLEHRLQICKVATECCNKVRLIGLSLCGIGSKQLHYSNIVQSLQWFINCLSISRRDLLAYRSSECFWRNFIYKQQKSSWIDLYESWIWDRMALLSCRNLLIGLRIGLLWDNRISLTRF